MSYRKYRNATYTLLGIVQPCHVVCRRTRSRSRYGVSAATDKFSVSNPSIIRRRRRRWRRRRLRVTTRISSRRGWPTGRAEAPPSQQLCGARQPPARPASDRQTVAAAFWHRVRRNAVRRLHCRVRARDFCAPNRATPLRTHVYV